MSSLVPSAAGSLLTPLRDQTQPIHARLKGFIEQPTMRRLLPWAAGAGALIIVGLVLALLTPSPQRILYSSLDDADRAAVVSTLSAGGISYSIDKTTGAITVREDDVYRARMLVASDGALAAPETGTELLNSLPMGASRTLEGDRLRTARERELTLTIAEIDGVQAVRVHIAEAARSVFVREDIPPSASVMLRMARGRQLSEPQVTAIANLVAGSISGLTVDAVRIIDQHGRLLSQPSNADSGGLDLQVRLESKLRAQLDQLLAPIIGVGNFSSEIQIALDMNEITSARESYEKEGAVRRETLQETQGGNTLAMGVPGVLSNTPPVQTEAQEGAPEGGPAAAAPSVGGESSASRTYELGREVAVSNVAPGSVRRLSVAVALNQDALKSASADDLKRIEDLIIAAVGADSQRGDVVTVMARPFQAIEMDRAPIWETPWFAMILRNAVALASVLLVLLLGVRPALNALIRARNERETGNKTALLPETKSVAGVVAGTEPDDLKTDRERLNNEIELAQQIVRERPDEAVMALRRMLNETPEAEPA